MNFEIKPYKTGDITVQGNQVTFAGYETLKNQALAISSALQSVTVTEDTLKTAKNTLATLRKSVKSLDDERIKVKNKLLESYTVFEKQVKEIKGIVDEGDKAVRQQVKAFEEAERETKHGQLVEIWNKRAIQYPVTDIIPDLYSKWETPSNLNKTTSVKASEKDMTAFLEKVQTEWETIQTLPDKEALRIAYCESLSLTSAIETVNAQKYLAERIAEQNDDEEEEAEETAVFVVTGTANIRLTEMLLSQNGVNYTRK